MSDFNLLTVKAEVALALANTLSPEYVTVTSYSSGKIVFGSLIFLFKSTFSIFCKCFFPVKVMLTVPVAVSL